MWNLFMGGTNASDDEQEASTVSGSNDMANLHVFHSTKIVSKAPSEGRHRIPSPTREQGDGMEAPKEIPPPESTQSQDFKPNSNLIVLPHTNIRLDKLPPIAAEKEVTLKATHPTSPLIKMTVSPPQTSVTAHPYQVARTKTRYQKEPKFVPYEPYKAATFDFTGTNPSGRRKISCQKYLPIPIKPLSKSDDERSAGHQEKMEIKKDENCSADSGLTNEDKLLAKLLEEANEKLRCCREELAETKKQLNIQDQVNTEVKKLLVASVGEDIQAKVDYLTQDKARLAADIRSYSSMLTRDFEEKEKLSVESDVWKSKFLACSVLIDELARSKAILMQKCDNFDHHVRLLMNEHAFLWENLHQTLQVLSRLKCAFDPLTTHGNLNSGPSSLLPTACNILDLAEMSMRSSIELSDRLLGKIKATNEEATLPVSNISTSRMDTPAEEGLKGLLSTKNEFADYSTQASVAVTGKARPYLAKISDKLASPDVNASHFKCCTHCQGSVHVV